VLEVIETVKRVFGIDFEVAFVGRRAGDPAQIVAAFNRARALLKWQPDFDNLQTIVCLTGMGAQVLTRRLTASISSRLSRIASVLTSPISGRVSWGPIN
jgi:UDP-glucose 4-epimerase